MYLDAMTLARARLAMGEAVRAHLFDPNVNLIDFGLPREAGQLIEDDVAIRFHVHKKHEGFALEAAIAAGQTNALLPSAIAVGTTVFRTDVVQGSYRPHVWSWGQPPAPDPHQARSDPMRGGISIFEQNLVAAGTLGGKVIDRATGAEMILSNWHVLVASWSARPGQRICQPGRLDNGSFADTVATLTRDAMGVNLDAAVATLSGARALINDQLEVGPVTGVGRFTTGMEVVKSGRTSGVTHGRVTTVIPGTAAITYGFLTRVIRQVITIEPIDFQEVSAPGDSGSWWIDPQTMRAIGLHFAGGNSPERGLAIDMQSVLDALNVDIATSRDIIAGAQAQRIALPLRSRALASPSVTMLDTVRELV